MSLRGVALTVFHLGSKAVVLVLSVGVLLDGAGVGHELPGVSPEKVLIGLSVVEAAR